MLRKFAFASAAALSLSALAFGQAATDETQEPEVKPLTIGDPARAIDIEHWIKGDKVTKFEPGKVYVVEFWATWCPPCRESMPHISKLQEQYKDYGVTFIGVSDEPLDTVKDFLPKKDKEGKTWDDKSKYTLTTDPDKSVHRDYMTAASQGGIPTAFIIGKDQHIEWIGHPMGIDKPLDAVVKDNWDRAEFKAKWEKEQAAEREAMKKQNELRKAMQAKDWDQVMSILDGMIALNEEAFGPKFQKFMTLLVQMDQPDKAYAYGEEIAKQHWEEPMALNQIAWTVVDSPAVKTRNLEFAERVASQANDLTDGKDPMILDTFARVYYEKGDLKNAIRLQKKAVDNAPEGEMGEDIKATLKKYEDEQAKKNSR